MKTLRLLLRASGAITVLTLLTGAVSGACNAGIIALINSALQEPRRSLATLGWIFAGLTVLKIASSLSAQLLMSRFSQRAVANLRRKLVRQILAVPLRHLEELGTPRILAGLIDDVHTISVALVSLPTMVVNATILLAGSVYLCWLAPKAFAAMTLFVMLGLGCYRLLLRRGYRYIRQARGDQDILYEHLRALTEGIKELKLHRRRREAFLDEKIQGTTSALEELHVRATRYFILGATGNQVLLFGAIAWILFGLPQMQTMSTTALAGYLLTFVYLLAPMNGLLNLVPFFGRAEVAHQKIEQLGVTLDTLAREPLATGSSECVAAWQTLRLDGVTHSYHRERDDSHFVLGPIDLSFRPAELVFLVGGNGSGKSTLAKVLVGLYPPETGAIWLDEQAINEQQRDAYRQNFAVVFSDFYLFESLLGLSGEQTDGRARDYLAKLHLDHKVTIQDGILSTTRLSQGQRKRLALLTAVIEDRPFYVFDEWASDQDPAFKEVFYLDILPELKARGKTVLVITHDERFLGVADRVLRMEEGKLRLEREAKPVSKPGPCVLVS